MAIFAKLARDHPEVLQYRSDLALSLLQSRPNSFEPLAELAPAEEAFKRAVAIREELARTRARGHRYQNDLAWSYLELSYLYGATGRSALREETVKRAVAILEGLTRSVPEDIQFQRSLAKGYGNLGEYYQAIGRTARAEEAFDQAVAILEGLTRSHPESTRF